MYLIIRGESSIYSEDSLFSQNYSIAYPISIQEENISYGHEIPSTHTCTSGQGEYRCSCCNYLTNNNGVIIGCKCLVFRQWLLRALPTYQNYHRK
ncbi:MAG: hypothetical protein LBP67_04800 [Bacteroidales bacterium]|jgi:hypothetical protein|nr:hypothetical protein [Bacteroidales bacterium]